MKWSIEAQTTAQGKVSCPPVSRSVVTVTVVTGVTRPRCRCHKTVNTDSDNVTLNIDTDTGWYRCRYRVIHIDNRYRHPDVDTDSAAACRISGRSPSRIIYSFTSNPSSSSAPCLWYLDDILSRKLTTSRMTFHIYIFQLFFFINIFS